MAVEQGVQRFERIDGSESCDDDERLHAYSISLKLDRLPGGVGLEPESALAPPRSSQLGRNSRLKVSGSQQTPVQSLVQCWQRRAAKMGGAGDIGPS